MNLSYSPSTADPLLVTFIANVVPGTPTLFNWSFGDGQYFNGSGPAFFTPVHHYPSAGGTFVVTVTVHEGSAINGTSLSLHLVPAPLAVGPTASPTSGNAPLTVTFQAHVAGGTGTYRSLVWNFGTGDKGSGISVPFTFVNPGHYVVSVNATDSSGVSATGSVEVNVTGSAPSSPGTFGAVDAAMVGAGVALGAGGGAAAMFYFQRRQLRRLAPAAVLPAPQPNGVSAVRPSRRPLPLPRPPNRPPPRRCGSLSGSCCTSRPKASSARTMSRRWDSPNPGSPKRWASGRTPSRTC